MNLDTLLEHIAKCFLDKETLDLQRDAKSFTLVSMQNKSFDHWNEDILFCGVKIGTIKHERTSSDVSGTISVCIHSWFMPVEGFLSQWTSYLISLSKPIPKYPLSSHKLEVPAIVGDHPGGCILVTGNELVRMPSASKVRTPFEREYMQLPFEDEIRADYQSTIVERSAQARPLRVHRHCPICDELYDDCTCKNKTL